ncbi:hypothetical protein D3C76_1878290 [compost metagenome]
MVEMIVVIVGQDYCFDLRQLIKTDRRLMKALGAGPLNRGSTLGEHRVGEPELIAQLQQDSGVA